MAVAEANAVRLPTSAVPTIALDFVGPGVAAEALGRHCAVAADPEDIAAHGPTVPSPREVRIRSSSGSPTARRSPSVRRGDERRCPPPASSLLGFLAMRVGRVLLGSVA